MIFLIKRAEEGALIATGKPRFTVFAAAFFHMGNHDKNENVKVKKFLKHKGKEIFLLYHFLALVS